MRNLVLRSVLSSCVLLALALAAAQGTTGSIHGAVLDPSGKVVPGATVEIQNPVSQFSRTVQSDARGNYAFSNIPYATYLLTVVKTGFQAPPQTVNVQSPVPVSLPLHLKLGASSMSVTVSAPGSLLQTSPITHTNISRELFEKVPLESQSSSLSSLVTLATPGIAADSNGLFHGLGDHASNSFSLDGQPITDQQSKVFSNQIPLDAVQSMQVIEGAPPAEFGGKTSTVIEVTTRSGLGANQPHGDITAGYGTFGSSNGGFDLVDGGNTWGNFISLDGLNTGRFLDGPELTVMHDHGNEENAFDRIDWKPSDTNSLSINLGFTRSWFQTPNSYDAQDATAWTGLVVSNNDIGPNGLPVGPQDQRSQIRTLNVAPTWTHIINANAVFTVGAWVRHDQYDYYPSSNPFSDLTPDLQLETVGQFRLLTNAGARADFAWVNRHNNIKIGADLDHTFLTENDSFGLVDPDTNAPCLYTATGDPYTSPTLNNPDECGGALEPNTGQNPSVSAFNPQLACYDLTRTGPLPASDGCNTTYSGDYDFLGHADIQEIALYAQDAITFGNWNFNLGLRNDQYDGLVTDNSIEPRLAGEYNVKRTHTLLRASYAHTMETPFNENLILASEGCKNTVIADIMDYTATPCVTNTPLSPGSRNEYHLGLEQAFGKYLVFDGEYIWKYTDRAFDFSVLGDTPITFPIEWGKSKIPGFALNTSMPNYHGISAYVDMSSVAARFFNPQVAGIGSTPIYSGSGVFRIDHDERFNQTTHVQYTFGKTQTWVGGNWRYDSGLVAGPVPCAGGACANGPNGSNSVVDVSELTPDQQFEAGLYCGSVHATPTTSISPNGLCPASEYGSTLLYIPAAGAENNDHNPPRVDPRSLFDLSSGDDNLFHTEKTRWSAQITVINVMNKEALYNFLSTFSGTHYVSPRTITATLGYHF